MSSTIQESLSSILSQLNNDFEVIVVDDGSNDNSLNIIYELQKKYSFLKVIPLERDKRRKLGETRNVSVRASNGKYVLLHLDTDDIWDPFDLDARFYGRGEKKKLHQSLTTTGSYSLLFLLLFLYHNLSAT